MFPNALGAARIWVTVGTTPRSRNGVNTPVAAPLVKRSLAQFCGEKALWQTLDGGRCPVSEASEEPGASDVDRRHVDPVIRLLDSGVGDVHVAILQGHRTFFGDKAAYPKAHLRVELKCRA